MIQGKDILLYLSLKYEGDWDKIYEAVRKRENVEENDALQAKKEVKANYVSLVDNNYPKCLKNVYKPPFVIFYYGDLSLLNDERKVLAVVGSRKCSPYSIANTKRIISELNNNFAIISGLAIGIDKTAHEAAIENNCKTIAVLGSGIDYVYPKQNLSLYQKIKQDGLIISEFPNNIEPKSVNFPIRNRLIVGGAFGVFIPEVKTKSGTMVSVAHALSQNKDVFILPQPCDNGTYNNHLIQEGACLVEHGLDILDEKK